MILHLSIRLTRLTVTEEGKGIATLPVLTTGRALNLVVKMTLTDTARLATSRGETTAFTMFHGGSTDPVVTGITTDGLVRRIDKDDFKVFEGGVLVDPVRIEDAQVGTLTTDTLFSNATEGTSGFELVNTVSGGFTHDLTLADLLLAASTTDTNTENDNSLLGFVSQTAGLIRAAGAAGTVNNVQLTIFPGTNT